VAEPPDKGLEPSALTSKFAMRNVNLSCAYLLQFRQSLF
jgi:hypothetical protein